MLRLKISSAAKNSIEEIRDYTLGEHGIAAMDRYDHLIKIAIQQIRKTPGHAGVRPSIKGLSKHHLSLSKNEAPVDGQIVKNPRHIVFFRVTADKTLEIAHILKDDMDFEKHL